MQPEFARAVAAVLLLNAADAAVSTIAPPFLQSLGYRVAEIGLLISAYAMASLVSRLPAGRLADARLRMRVSLSIWENLNRRQGTGEEPDFLFYRLFRLQHLPRRSEFHLSGSRLLSLRP